MTEVPLHVIAKMMFVMLMEDADIDDDIPTEAEAQRGRKGEPTIVRAPCCTPIAAVGAAQTRSRA